MMDAINAPQGTQYQVIALFPQGVFKFQLDEILTKKGIHYCGEVKSIKENEIDLYPHLFKKVTND